MPFWDFLRRRSGRGRPAHEPKRDTLAWPNLSTLGQASPQAQRIVYKPVPKNLRYFSRTPIFRRAINSIKNPIAQLEWEIAPVDGVKLNSELERQIQAAAAKAAPKVEDSEPFKKLQKDFEGAQQKIKYLQAAAENAKPAPERKTLPPLVTSVLAKAGIGLPEGGEKLSVQSVNAALDKVAGLSFGQRAEVKLHPTRAGLLEATTAV